VLDAMKPSVSLYMGGMGARDANFHNQVFQRMGYEQVAAEVQRLYLAGQKDQATALIPDELVDDMNIIGTPGEVRDKVAQWQESGVTTLVLGLRSPDQVRSVAELLA
jgi:alkanesulfonate monooxygenase SsuD/methylene tetrahydromethanopterin reductase-like flavin-dependent oxidoreductase (luciferase family)